jgi:succinoglycan biosynthesis transport protein ExoP
MTAEMQILRSYLIAIYRRRWTAFGVFVVTLAVVVWRTFAATPIYEATAQILIEADNSNVTSFDDVLQTNRRALEYFQTQYRLLASRALAKRALVLSNLLTNPAFAPRDQVRVVPATAADPLSALLDSGLAASVGESAAESIAIQRFLAALTVMPVRNSRLVDVTFASPDPAIAQRAANALVDAYIQQASDLRTRATKDATSFLSQMVAEQRKAVEQSEFALQRYREQGDSISLEDRQNVVVERITSLNAAVSKARTDRIQKENVYNLTRAAASDPTKLEALPSVRENADVQRLNAEIGDLKQRRAEMAPRLGVNHPNMVKVTVALDSAQLRLREAIATIERTAGDDYHAAVDLEQAMTNALERQKAEGLALNRRGIDYGVLQRDATTNRQLYEALLQRTKQTGIAEQLKTISVRIVDVAELPRSPARPNKQRDIVLGLLMATVLALGVVLGLEAFDTRVKSPDDVTGRLGLACLGMVPQMTSQEFGGAPLLLAKTAPQNFVESFRSLRTSILFASAERGAKSVLVSSTAPGEGKTLVSCNLALALAMAGQRVCLVDADLRRPKVHNLFGVPLVPGLSNILVGDATADAAIQATASDSLSILSAGMLPPNPPELLGSPQFAELLRSLSASFDWIVLDSPPVRAVTDAQVVAHLVTAVVFVIGAEMTDMGAAKNVLDRLKAANAKIAGAVLNRVQLRRHSYYYAPYYGQADEGYYQQSQASRT